MERPDYPIRKIRIGEDERDPHLESTTAEERILMMWPLTVQAWAFKGEDVSESRLQRHVVHIFRRGC